MSKTRNLCLAKFKEYVCTKNHNHKGFHETMDFHGNIVGIWDKTGKFRLYRPEKVSEPAREPSIGSPSTKLTNPKDIIGSDKLPMHLWPETATALGCLALLDGALKYGRTNWRVAGVRTSIYIDAVKRHIAKWSEGEDDDPDSGLPHLSHALACLAILVDAGAAGKLNDDRVVQGGYVELVGALTPHVARLKALHAGKTPRHYTIADSVREEKA